MIGCPSAPVTKLPLTLSQPTLNKILTSLNVSPVKALRTTPVIRLFVASPESLIKIILSRYVIWSFVTVTSQIENGK